MSTKSVRELGYLFLTMSSLHIIASDLDVKDHCHGGSIALDDGKSYNSIKDLLLYNNMPNYSKSPDVK